MDLDSGGGPPWPRKVRVTPRDGGAPKYADFPPPGAHGGLLHALQGAVAAKFYPGRQVVLFFPDGTEVY